jgi:hypothetical protein
LTEGIREVIFKLRGIITYFFDNEERKKSKSVPLLAKAKASA